MKQKTNRRLAGWFFYCLQRLERSNGSQDTTYLYRTRLEAMRMRKALSLMNPSASFWL